jgi:hypothetical protein
LPFIGAQLVGGAVGLAMGTLLFPRTSTRTEP